MIRHFKSYFSRNTYKLFTFKTIHLVLSIAIFYVSFIFFRYGSLTDMDRYGFRYNYFVALLYGTMIVFFVRTYNAYLLGYTRVRALVFGQFLAQLLSIVILYMVISIAWNKFKNPIYFFPMLIAQIVLDVLWSYYGNALFYRLHGKRKTLLIYRNQIDKIRFGTIKGKPTERMYEISDEIQYDGSFAGLKDKLEGYDTIFVAGVNSRCRNGILKYCKENNVYGLFLPHIGDTIMQDAKHIQAFDSPVLAISRKELSPEFAVIKRVFDIVSSGLALLLLSPIILLTAIVIKMYDGGPAFYRQTRLTRDGKRFNILKFRSMRVDAEKDGVARLSKGENDDRITPVGRIIRRYRLDEIPQLWNILKGDMSVVGPRPERPEIAEQYCQSMPEFKLRLQVKAGLTGYAQVYGKYNTSPYEKLEFDLLYINNMNILIDVQLCFATLMTVFKKESTEGVEGITAEISEIK